MSTLTISLLPSNLNAQKESSLFVYKTRRLSKKSQSIVPVIFIFFLNSLFCLSNLDILHCLIIDICDWWFQVARLFGPSIFEASKLKVLFLGVDEKKHPGKLPRTYTLTHSDITSKLTLAISQTINNSQVIPASYSCISTTKLKNVIHFQLPNF